ncbi:indolepyruvate oxidoreductase subunit beta [Eggerthella sinensis]|uniref:indolepyruvate oxidoreductase subunit beta n=1 Tax=Eggerthella sinensis TaxID=242230 RepID=UPI001D099CD6|nr:indolepyruvate oxidoreductase subunit beta [Eggerthella sinensis]MCB7036645.1 indolepyruvate oxidoreductase subunit beta [Eggerthella sinensis]
MRNVMLAGVGGQGTVLAAKVLAQAAQDKGWQVRTAETIGMAQRGGNVVSHVRMGDEGEEVFAPLLAQGTADLIIAFEPAEAARVLPFLAPDGLLVTATTAIQPVTAALSDRPYRADDVVGRIEQAIEGSEQRFIAVDDAQLTDAVGSRKVLNSVLLASALKEGRIALDLDDLRRAIEECVKPRFVALNVAAIDAVEKA